MDCCGIVTFQLFIAMQDILHQNPYIENMQDIFKWMRWVGYLGAMLTVPMVLQKTDG